MVKSRAQKKSRIANLRGKRKCPEESSLHPSTSGLRLSSPQYSSSSDEFLSSPVHSSSRKSPHTTPYFPKKMSDPTLEREILQETLEEDWYSGEDEVSCDEPSMLAPVPPIPNIYTKAVDTLVSKVKKDLNFEEIESCLKEFPSFVEEDSEEDSTESDIEVEALVDNISVSPVQVPLQKRRKKTLKKPSGSSMEKTATSKRSKYTFFIPTDAGCDEDFAKLCGNYEETMNTLLNIDVLEGEEDSTPKKNIPIEPSVEFDRMIVFNLDYPIDGFVQSQTIEDSALIKIKKLDDLSRKMGNVCEHCDSRNIKYSLRRGQRNYFCQTLQGKCHNCSKLLGHVTVRDRVKMSKKGATIETDMIAMKMCIGALEAGVGFTALHKILSSVNLPTVSGGQFHIYLHNFLEIIEGMVENMKTQAAEIVTEYYKSIGIEPQEGLMNVQVSFDETWLRKEYGSMIGLGFIVEVETGIILDYHILSKYCNTCIQHLKKEKNMSEEEKHTWKEEHKEKCSANYSGEKSSSMEGEIAEVLFARSVERGLRYTTILSDDVSPTFNRLTKLNPYGKTSPVKKQNFLDHINEKIYRRLNNLRTTRPRDGKGERILTKKSATIFTNFYRVFVKKYHSNHTLLKKNILASVFHHAATDQYPLHQLCPKGANSWCKYQRDSFNQVNIGKTWHKRKENRKYFLGKEAAKAVLGVMLSMTSEEVLTLVSKGAQSVNESLHSKVWSIIPKSKYRGVDQVKYATARVAMNHNCGEKAASMLRCLGIEAVEHPERREEIQARSTEKSKQKRKSGRRT
ncbi:UNVERIFIED_CONTAM: hypothetical protein RMT77_000244 [Armadillidium vulgare]